MTTTDDNMDAIVRCDECGERIRMCLVDRGSGPVTKLACDCFVLDRTEGMSRQFEGDMPDKWCVGLDKNYKDY